MGRQRYDGGRLRDGSGQRTRCADDCCDDCDCEAGGPTADFTYSANVNGTCTIDFTDASTAGECGAITGWSWKCGATEFSTSQNPTGIDLSSVCAGGDPWTITLTVTDASGCTDEISKPVTCTDCSSHTASFTFSTSVDSTKCRITFTNTRTPSSGVSSYLWEFSDGTTSTVASPVKDLTTNDYVEATLTVTWSNGCQDTVGPVPIGCCANCNDEDLPDTITVTGSGWSDGATYACSEFNGAHVLDRLSAAPFGCIWQLDWSSGGDDFRVRVEVKPGEIEVLFLIFTGLTYAAAGRFRKNSFTNCIGSHTVTYFADNAVCNPASVPGSASLTI